MGILPFLLFAIIGLVSIFAFALIFNLILNELNISAIPILVQDIFNLTNIYFLSSILIIISTFTGLVIGSSLSLMVHPRKKVTEKGGLLFGACASLFLLDLIDIRLINHFYLFIGIFCSLVLGAGAYFHSEKYIEEVKIKWDYPIKLARICTTIFIISICVFSIYIVLFQDWSKYFILRATPVLIFYSIAGILIQKSINFKRIQSMQSQQYGITLDDLKNNSNSSFIIGHQNSGKTVLGVGLYKCATDTYEGQLTTSKLLKITSKKHYEDIPSTFAFMTSEGKYHKGTERSEFISNVITVGESIENKLLFGKEDITISFGDYGGEHLDSISKLLKSDSIESHASTLIDILREEYDDEIDEKLIGTIEKDMKSLNFDYVKYKIDWSSISGDHLKYSAPIYIMSKIKNSKKLIFLIDGKQFIPILLQINPTYALKLKNTDLNAYNEYKDVSTKQFLYDIASYTAILNAKELNIQGKPIIFVVTKSDELIDVYKKIAERIDSDEIIKLEKELYDEMKGPLIKVLLEVDLIKQLIKASHKNVKDYNKYIKLVSVIPQKGSLLILGIDNIIEWIKK